MKERKIIYAEEIIEKLDIEYDEKLATYETLKGCSQLRVDLGLFTLKDVEKYCFGN